MSLFHLHILTGTAILQLLRLILFLRVYPPCGRTLRAYARHDIDSRASDSLIAASIDPPRIRHVNRDGVLQKQEEEIEGRGDVSFLSGRNSQRSAALAKLSMFGNIVRYYSSFEVKIWISVNRRSSECVETSGYFIQRESISFLGYKDYKYIIYQLVP